MSLHPLLKIDPSSSKYAVPRDFPCDEIDWIHGRAWARNFPRICPYCKLTFFGWSPQPWPQSWTPDAMETEKDFRLGSGHHHTCGRPECVFAAQDEHFEWEQKERARLRALKLEREALDRAAAENDEKFARERFR